MYFLRTLGAVVLGCGLVAAHNHQQQHHQLHARTAISNTTSSRDDQSTAVKSTSAVVKPAKAVFAHYMVGIIEDDHARQDVQTALDLGLDAFSLNVGDATPEWLKYALDALFDWAEKIGFKLFLSMDISASGNACYQICTSCGKANDFSWIIEKYGNSSAYYHVDGKPLVTTFSSGGLEFKDWQNWRQNLSMPIYFVPGFDDTLGYYTADPAWSYWGDAVNGVASWESSWPLPRSNTTEGSVEKDNVVVSGTSQRNKSYMIGLSPLQYKNAYNTNAYRRGGSTLSARMDNILKMKTQPDFVQYHTWNDMPESHYIAEIWQESNTEYFPSLYANHTEWSHVGWQGLLSSFITAFKSGSSVMRPIPGEVATGALWYKTILQSTVCTTGIISVPVVQTPKYCNNVTNKPSEEYFEKPGNFDEGDDNVHWAVVVPESAKGWTLDVVSGGSVLASKPLKRGLNYGATGVVRQGTQSIVVRDAERRILMKADGGKNVSDQCEKNIYNMNYQVAGLKAVQ